MDKKQQLPECACEFSYSLNCNFEKKPYAEALIEGVSANISKNDRFSLSSVKLNEKLPNEKSYRN